MFLLMLVLLIGFTAGARLEMATSKDDLRSWLWFWANAAWALLTTAVVAWKFGVLPGLPR